MLHFLNANRRFLILVIALFAVSSLTLTACKSETNYFADENASGGDGAGGGDSPTPSTGMRIRVKAKTGVAAHIHKFGDIAAGCEIPIADKDTPIRDMDKRKAEAAKASGKRASGSRQAKGVKDTLQALHDEVKQAERFYTHITWLQERFPNAAYEDVTGLCKLATRAEMAEQDRSLNPGRYVGVVIEEDGKTEDESLEELLASHEEFTDLSEQATALQATIAQNVNVLVG